MLQHIGAPRIWGREAAEVLDDESFPTGGYVSDARARRRFTNTSNIWLNSFGHLRL